MVASETVWTGGWTRCIGVFWVIDPHLFWFGCEMTELSSTGVMTVQEGSLWPK